MAGDKSYRLQSVTKKKNTSSKMKLKKKKSREETMYYINTKHF